jgi:glucose/arabinose dehydrogenase
MMNRSDLPLLSALVLALASCGAAPAGESAGQAHASPVVNASLAGFAITDYGRFDEPWAMAFIPGTPYALITEKSGKLKLWQDGADPREVAGVPRVDYGGQGGLGDVAVSPRFAEDGMIYLSWAEAGPNDTRGAAVGRARLMLDGAPRLGPVEVIWRQDKVTGRGHYSHRLTFSPDGTALYIASGDRQKKTPAQDDSSNLGKIVKLDIANAGPAGPPQVVSKGHRNVLGLQFDAEGRLWDLEHGPAGGDEFNLVKPGQNYGWPLVSNGDNYNGSPIPRHATRPDLATPAISWTPVIAPGDFIFYSGDLFPGWKGNAVIAGMGSAGLVRVAMDGERAREVERIPLGRRIREVRQGPDGAIWVLEDGEGARLRRMVPRK